MGFIDLAGLALEITRKSDGKVFKLSQISFLEMAQFVLWYKFKEASEVNELTKDYPADLRNKLVEEAYERCRLRKYKYLDPNSGEEKEAELSWEQPEIQNACNTLEGIHQQLYLSLKIANPELKEKEVSEICSMYDYYQLLDKLLLVAGLKKDETGEPNPNQ